MNVLAFAASNSRQSINKQLAHYAASIVSDTVELIDLNDYEMPIYSGDREAQDGIPELAQRLFTKIGQADAVVISFAEHNGSYTAAYKNIFDWMSRINQKVFQNKAMVLLATSPGPGGAKSVLAAATGSAPFFAADVKASFSVASFYDNFDVEKQQMKNQAIDAALRDAMALLSA